MTVTGVPLIANPGPLCEISVTGYAWLREGHCEEWHWVQDCFLHVDASYCEREAAQHAERAARLGAQAGPRSYAGCTAIAALLVRDQLWIANAGDFRQQS